MFSFFPLPSLWHFSKLFPGCCCFFWAMKQVDGAETLSSISGCMNLHLLSERLSNCERLCSCGRWLKQYNEEVGWSWSCTSRKHDQYHAPKILASFRHLLLTGYKGFLLLYALYSSSVRNKWVDLQGAALKHYKINPPPLPPPPCTNTNIKEYQIDTLVPLTEVTIFLILFRISSPLLNIVRCPDALCSCVVIPKLVLLTTNWSTLKVLVATIDVQWEGLEDVGSVRYEPALHPPCPTIRVLSYSN